MEKILIATILLIPLVVKAQPPGAGGRGFPGNGPPGGKGLEPGVMLEDLINEADMARDRVGYAADLLYPAAETFFIIVNEVTALPELSATWDEVNAALADAWDDEELNEAEEDYRTYVEDFGNCRAALDKAWKDKRERKEVVNRLAGYRESLLAVQTEVEVAVEISKSARADLKEVTKRLKDAKDMASRMPPFPGGALPEPPVVRSLSAKVEEAEAAKDKAEGQIALGKELLKKLDKML
jgi:hypothetical protein